MKTHKKDGCAKPSFLLIYSDHNQVTSAVCIHTTPLV